MNTSMARLMDQRSLLLRGVVTSTHLQDALAQPWYLLLTGQSLESQQRCGLLNDWGRNVDLEIWMAEQIIDLMFIYVNDNIWYYQSCKHMYIYISVFLGLISTVPILFPTRHDNLTTHQNWCLVGGTGRLIAKNNWKRGRSPTISKACGVRYFRKQFVGETFAVEKIGRLKQFWKNIPSPAIFPIVFYVSLSFPN